jgi:hypothetical protein
MMSDFNEAVQLLQDDGLSETEALRTLAADPSAVERLSLRIQERRERIAQEEANAAAAEFMASPEGLLEQARAARRGEAERAEAGEDAKALLRAQGVDPELVAGMNTDEALTAAGIEQNPVYMSLADRDRLAEQDTEYQRQVELARVRETYDRMSDEGRAVALANLGIDRGEFEAEREREAWAKVGLKPPSERGEGDGGEAS